MLRLAKTLYFEFMSDPQYLRASYDFVEGAFMQECVDRLCLPEVAVAFFMDVKGWDRTGKTLDATWEAMKRCFRSGDRWLTVREAKESGAWDDVKKVMRGAKKF